VVPRNQLIFAGMGILLAQRPGSPFVVGWLYWI
jgi:hypothetical protein